MVLDCSKLEKALNKKGFKCFVGSKHTKYIFYYNNIKTGINLEVSRNGKELRDTMIGILTHEMKLDNKNQLFNFYKCDLSKEEYTKWLIDKNHI